MNSSVLSALESIAVKHNFVNVGDDHVDMFELEKDDFDAERFFRRYLLVRGESGVQVMDFDRLQVFLSFLSGILQGTCEEIATSVDIFLPRLKEISAVFHGIHHSHSKAEDEKSTFLSLVRCELEEAKRDLELTIERIENERMFESHESDLRALESVVEVLEELAEEVRNMRNSKFAQSKATLTILRISFVFSNCSRSLGRLTSKAITELLRRHCVNEKVNEIRESIYNLLQHIFGSFQEFHEITYSSETEVDLEFKSGFFRVFKAADLVDGNMILANVLAESVLPSILKDITNENSLRRLVNALSNENSFLFLILHLFNETKSQFYISRNEVFNAFYTLLTKSLVNDTRLINTIFNPAVPQAFYSRFLEILEVRKEALMSTHEDHFANLLTKINTRTYIELRKKEALEYLTPFQEPIILDVPGLSTAISSSFTFTLQVSLPTHLDQFLGILLLILKKAHSLIELSSYTQPQSNLFLIIEFTKELSEGRISQRMVEAVIATDLGIKENLETATSLPLLQLIKNLCGNVQGQYKSLASSMCSRVCDKTLLLCISNLEPYHSIPAKFRNLKILPNKSSNFLTNIFRPLSTFLSSIPNISESIQSLICFEICSKVISRLQEISEEVISSISNSNSEDSMAEAINRQFEIDLGELKTLVLQRFQVEIF